MLSVSNFHFSVGDKAILKGLTLDVTAGAAPAVTGSNGAGRSTVWYAGERRSL